MPMNTLVSLSAASTVTGYSTDTIRRWARDGRILAVKGPTVNSPWKIDIDDLKRMLREGASVAREGLSAPEAVPIVDGVKRWRASAEYWIDNAVADGLSEEERRQVLLDLVGIRGDGGLVGELNRLAERLR